MGMGKEVSWSRLSAQRGQMSHSYRNIVLGFAESYTSEQAASLTSTPVVYNEEEKNTDDEMLHSSADACSHCNLRRLNSFLSSCSCNRPCAQLCLGCLSQRYGEAPPLPLHWKCPECRGISNAAPYREARGWGSLGSSSFADARAAGYASVAHWTVLRRTGVVNNFSILFSSLFSILSSHFSSRFSLLFSLPSLSLISLPFSSLSSHFSFLFPLFNLVALFFSSSLFSSPLSFQELTRVSQVLDSDIQEAIPNRGKRGRPLGGGGEFAKRVRAVQRSGSVGQRPLIMVPRLNLFILSEFNPLILLGNLKPFETFL